MTSPARASRSRRKPTGPEIPPAAEESPRTSPLFLPPEDLPAEMTTDPEPLPPSSNPSPSDLAGAVSESPSGTPSTPGDSKPADPPKLTRRALRGYASKAIVSAGRFAQSLLTARESAERAEGVWLPDEEDVRDMADPVAGLVSRKLPAKLGGAAANPDVEDGIALALALFAYVGKQLERRAEIRARYVDAAPDMTPADAELVPA